VQGRPAPLKVYGPRGVDEVTKAVNAGYRMDRIYRIYRAAHHGEALLSPGLGVLQHKTISEGIILEDGDLKVTAYMAGHPPIEPAVGYRFDYRGRSVVISGDSNVTVETRKIIEGADLLLHDALSVPVVLTLSAAAGQAGLSRISKIMADVLDYHASTTSLVELGVDANVDMVAFYHLVPSPVNALVEEIFKRDLPDNYLLAADGMWFDLPVSGDDIVVTGP